MIRYIISLVSIDGSRAALQGLCGADAIRGNLVCSGLEARSLHQSTSTSDVFGYGISRPSVDMRVLTVCHSAEYWDTACLFHSDRCEGMDVPQRQGHLYSDSTKLSYLSTQCGIFHGVSGLVCMIIVLSTLCSPCSFKGSHRAHTAVWSWLAVSP